MEKNTVHQKGAFSEEHSKAAESYSAAGTVSSSTTPTPDTLLRRFELLGKSLWIAMGTGLVIMLWTVAALVVGPATAPEPTDPGETSGMSGTDNDQDSTDKAASDQPVNTQSQGEPKAETEKLPVEQNIKPNNVRPKQPAKRTPAPATNQKEPVQRQTPEQKQPDTKQYTEPAEEQQYQQQPLQLNESKE